MAANSPGELVEGPNCVPTRYGLLTVAEIEDRADGPWLQGFYTETPDCGDVAETRVYTCPQATDPKEQSGSGLTFPESDPFTMIGEYDCSTVGRPLSEAWALAEADLDRQESRTLERVFWAGVDALGNNVRLTLGGTQDAGFEVEDLTPGGGAVSITDGVALLEDWAGENLKCSPVLHIQRGVSTYLVERNITSPEGQIMYNRGTGSRVAVGGGYLATGPEGSAAVAGEAWVFITGGIKILRGPKFFTPDRDAEGAAVDRQVNDITVFAERSYGISLACGIAAVRVTLESCC